MQNAMRLLARPFAAAAVTTMWVCAAPAVNAQAPSQSPDAAEQALSDHKIDQAAAALEQVVNVKRDYQKRIESADPSERQRIADEADDAVEKAVTDQGLSVEEYTSILVVAQSNPKVREKVLRRVRPSED